MEKVKPIDTNAFTDSMMKEMRKALRSYDYIQKHYPGNDENFQSEFSKFYGLNVNGQLNQNKALYFETLKKATGDENIMDLVRYFYDNMKPNTQGKRGYQLSFSSKLLHTKNPNLPIYDSRVIQYLNDVEFENDKFENVYQAKNEKKLEKIERNWNRLLNWSKESVKPDSKWQTVIQWFNEMFPEYAHISDVKKIDTTIYVWVKSTT